MQQHFIYADTTFDAILSNVIVIFSQYGSPDKFIFHKSKMLHTFNNINFPFSAGKYAYVAW